MARGIQAVSLGCRNLAELEDRCPAQAIRCCVCSLEAWGQQWELIIKASNCATPKEISNPPTS